MGLSLSYLTLAASVAEVLAREPSSLVAGVAFDVLRRLLMKNVFCCGLLFVIQFFLLTSDFFLKDFYAAWVAIGLAVALELCAVTLLTQSVFLPLVL